MTTYKHLDRLAKAERLDARRRPAIKGRGPDSDEATDASTSDNEYGKPKSTGYRHTAEGGFWKRSEDLACRQGKPMRSDYRGLPPGYMES